ncbi:MAG: hypothetical protein A2622_01985 [Bdellovibrionales bacterium RIFCSPHIGHO2_01_FULL_40_29]|nr:MAG: hypothetical protein A2622_01985 [Bdellovibrionales bacterium RIFCSPHIGHO2_01_FULL_40_29]OFZ33859.1 MAG: hypothetical protein A3D17_02405 [Bdellovibrionales bacterium RIFCSPHIGHO2_02_FULL_40_15]
MKKIFLSLTFTLCLTSTALAQSRAWFDAEYYKGKTTREEAQPNRTDLRNHSDSDQQKLLSSGIRLRFEKHNYSKHFDVPLFFDKFGTRFVAYITNPSGDKLITWEALDRLVKSIRDYNGDNTARVKSK